MTASQEPSPPDSSNKTSTSPDTQAAIELRQVEFTYPRAQHPVLKIAAWMLPRGRRVFLHGPSGSGKTTLLNLLGGMQVPNQGEVNILGERLSAFSGSQRDRFRARHIGMIFQQFNLIPWLSVADNIAAATHFARRSAISQQIDQRLAELLDALSLDKALLTRRTSELSVGQQQRVAIARALINEPELIIADEPTSSLDSDARDDFLQLLLGLVKAKDATLVFVSHDASLAQHFDERCDLRSINGAGKEAEKC